MNFNAYHFVGNDLRDGRPVPTDNETLTHAGEIVWCKSGLYASDKPWQALKYAPGHTLCRVRCEDIERRDDDKFVCRKRTIVSRIDAETLLLDFARSCARDVLHLWDAPDVVVEYLETGNEDLMAAASTAASTAASAAASAARAAASAAASTAAWDARAAAWAAASAAAWDAWDARAASMAAAWDARAAAWDAAEKKQRHRFTRMVNQAFEGAAQ